MLTKVEIENFMSHQNTVLEFVPGTNVIIGESDQGKSAAFTAINWVINNRPLGDFFRSIWGGDTRVALYTVEGDVIERIRTDNKNEYRINGEILEAFGTQVPQEVSDILQLDGYNIQAQMDPDFLLSQTPGEVARILNKAAAIDEIDTTISGISKALYQINSGIRYKEKQIKEYEQEINQYRNLPEIETKIQQAEELEILKQNQNRKLTELRGILFRIQQVEFTLERTKHLPKVIDMVIKVESELDEYKETKIQKSNIERIISRLRKVYEAMEATQKEIIRLEKEQEKIPLDICPICGGTIRKGEKHEKSETETLNIYQG
jgi:DNA repair ATPase RecN